MLTNNLQMNSYEWVGTASNRVIIELKRTADLLTDVHSLFFKKFDISTTKFNLLYLLYTSPTEGMMLSEIGNRMLVTKGNITGLVDRLEKQGLVERRLTSNDRRKVHAVISEKGKEYTEKTLKAYSEWSANIMDVIEDDEKKQIISIFKKLQNKLSI